MASNHGLTIACFGYGVEKWKCIVRLSEVIVKCEKMVNMIVVEVVQVKACVH